MEWDELEDAEDDDSLPAHHAIARLQYVLPLAVKEIKDALRSDDPERSSQAAIAVIQALSTVVPHVDLAEQALDVSLYVQELVAMMPQCIRTMELLTLTARSPRIRLQASKAIAQCCIDLMRVCDDDEFNDDDAPPA